MEEPGKVQRQELSLSLGETVIKDDQGEPVLKVELTPTHLHLYDGRGGHIIGMARYLIDYLRNVPLNSIDERDLALLKEHEIVSKLSPPVAIDYEARARKDANYTSFAGQEDAWKMHVHSVNEDKKDKTLTGHGDSPVEDEGA